MTREGHEARIRELEAELAQLRRELEGRDSASAPRGPVTVPAHADILAAIPAYVVILDEQLRLRYINRLQPGFTLEAVLGRSMREFVAPADFPLAERVIRRVFETGVGDSYMTHGKGPHGTTILYESFVVPFSDEPGRTGIALISVDHSILRLRDRNLRETNEKLGLALEATRVGLWDWNAASGEVIWDARMCEIMGSNEPLPFARYIKEAVHPEDRARLEAESGARVASPGNWRSAPHRIVRPDGQVRWVAVWGVTVFDDTGAIERVSGATMDITEQRAIEDELRSAQRLDALGHLTAGVAHNFNNLLTVILSTLDLLGHRIPSPHVATLDEARQAAVRASELVRDLMTFAGQRPRTARTPRALRPMVEQAVHMCGRTFERHITLACRVECGLERVESAANEIEQIVVNLLLNARDAVLAAKRHDARIEVNVTRATPRTAQANGAPRELLRVRVADNGSGIRPDVLPHVFDPFFTTKAVGEGTGLGLATSYAIARELGGTLTCTATSQEGTTFDLEIPVASAPPDDRRVPPAPTTPKTTCRVLLVDDEAPLRRAIAGLLEAEGFEVEAVASGEAALAAVARDPTFDVVLLDRSMPGAPGEAFIDPLRSALAEGNVVLFSGTTTEAALAARVDAVLTKPVGADELLGVLRRVVGARCAIPSSR